MTDRYEVEKVAEGIYISLVAKSGKTDPAAIAEQSFHLAAEFVAYRDLERQQAIDQARSDVKDLHGYTQREIAQSNKQK